MNLYYARYKQQYYENGTWHDTYCRNQNIIILAADMDEARIKIDHCLKEAETDNCRGIMNGEIVEYTGFDLGNGFEDSFYIEPIKQGENYELNKKQAIAEHRKLWNWLAETGSRFKSEYFIDNGIKGEDIPDQYCYCCEYDKNNPIADNTHCNCPIDWIYSEGCYGDTHKGLYCQWILAETTEERKKLAKAIAELPERK